MSGSRSAPRARSTRRRSKRAARGWRSSRTRRGPVIGFSLLAWVLAAVLVVAAHAAARSPRSAVRLLGLSVVYLPLLLLVGAALEPAQYPEMLLVMLGAPLLAALTLAALRDYRALAVAAGAHRRRLRARRDRRLAAHRALAARPEPGPRRPLLRDRQRARGAARGADRRRHRRRRWRASRRASRRAAAPSPSSSSASSSPAIFASGEFGADVGAAIDFPVGRRGRGAGGHRRRAAAGSCW